MALPLENLRLFYKVCVLFKKKVLGKINVFYFYLENPVLCDENLPKLVGMFEMYYARLMGIAHCIVPQLLPIVDTDSSHIQTPPMDFLASIMKPNQPLQLGGSQMPSIVQIIVPVQSLKHIPVIDNANHTDDVIVSTTVSPGVLSDELLNRTFTSPSSNDTSTVEPLRSSIPPQQQPSTTVLPETEKEDDIDDIQLNEDIDSSDDYQENEEKNKKQRDRSDFRYVESFESEKSIAQKFDPDPSENDTELKNVINENYHQIPSVLPVPNALSSSKNAESEDLEPPEAAQDQNLSEPDI